MSVFFQLPTALLSSFVASLTLRVLTGRTHMEQQIHGKRVSMRRSRSWYPFD